MSVQMDARSTNQTINQNFASSSNEPDDIGNDFYKNNFPSAGYALIFNQIKFDDSNNYKRVGADIDSKNLEDVFKKCGFTVKMCLNYTVQRIEEEVREVSRQDHSNSNCLAVIMMSHGDNEHNVYARDGAFQVDVLWKHFSGERCPSLCGKPKLFFIQACRGSLPDFGTTHFDQLETEEMSRLAKAGNEIYFRKIPIMADFMIMFSCAEGYPSFRDQDVGSWFIDELCKEFRRYLNVPHNDDLMRMLTRVNRRVAYTKEAYDPTGDSHCHKQMPVITSMLTKIFYFNRNHINRNA